MNEVIHRSRNLAQDPQDQLKIEWLFHMTQFSQEFGIVDHTHVITLDLWLDTVFSHDIRHIYHVREAVNHYKFQKKVLFRTVIYVYHGGSGIKGCQVRF